MSRPRAARRSSKVRRRRWVVGAALIVLAAAVVGIVTSSTSFHTVGARLVHVTIPSRLVPGHTPATLVVPRGGGRGRPLLVFLHGRGADQDSEISDQLFTALAKLGREAPDIVFPYGGEASYWHDRSGGAWGSYVLREVIPQALVRLGADPRRIAIGGISMGGLGAYDLARLAPNRFCAVGGHSAALWMAAGDSAAGAFDSSTDFSHHDVIALARAGPARYGQARLWLDGGDQDPFHAADEALAAALHIRMHVWPGAHDSDYWNAHWRDYLAFYGAALAACRVTR